MNVHRTPFVCALLILIACGLFPKVATAQNSMSQWCSSLSSQLSQAIREHSPKKMIYFQRQILSNCKQYMQPDDYTDALGFLALALDEDGQYNEELGVANRCLTYNANALSCISTKVAVWALWHSSGLWSQTLLRCDACFLNVGGPIILATTEWYPT